MAEGRRGAARSETARLAILEATARQFAGSGFDHLTMEGIAADAGVGKQTIYRWWPSKAALVAEALIEGMLLPDRFVPADTGDIRRDLADWLDDLFAFVGDPAHDTLVRSLFAVAIEHADVGTRLRENLGTSLVAARMDSAVAAGQIPPDAPRTEIVELLVGGVVFRILNRTPITPDTSGRLVAAVLGA
ncbi:TetR/AcrR family transcriptional regulator [Agromyces archimandritae]|uniref:TetR/AcrR family transcriptional regulator n=1 Tax=Agromyces archimandritae TaxID=2781962 RepID=A0A975FP33_9MICO|nr:TetR/AcrR family transcriptional regulator [Agromyces archimandritae]QTX06003.1 TetR/AcrR family transcriptional regulator [Agromyces archimandritae]